MNFNFNEHTSNDFFVSRIEWVQNVPKGPNNEEWQKFNSSYNYCSVCHTLFDPILHSESSKYENPYMNNSYDRKNYDPRMNCSCPADLSLIRRSCADIKLDSSRPSDEEVETATRIWEEKYEAVLDKKSVRQMNIGNIHQNEYTRNKSQQLVEETLAWEVLEVLVWNRSTFLRNWIQHMNRTGQKLNGEDWPEFSDPKIGRHIKNIARRTDPWPLDGIRTDNSNIYNRKLWCKKHRCLGEMYPINDWRKFLECGICMGRDENKTDDQLRMDELEQSRIFEQRRFQLNSTAIDQGLITPLDSVLAFHAKNKEDIPDHVLEAARQIILAKAEQDAAAANNRRYNPKRFQPEQ